MRRARCVTGSVELYSQIEVIVGVVRIGVDGFLEIFSGAFSVSARADHSEIVVNLSQGQADGDEVESRLGSWKISLVVGRKSQIEVRLTRQRIIFGQARERGDSLVVLSSAIVGFAQLQEGFGIVWAEANGFTKVLNLSFRSWSSDSANVVLKRVQADGRSGVNIRWLRDRDVRTKRVQNIPRQRGLNIDQLNQWTGLIHLGQQVLAAHVEQLRGCSEGSAIEA